MGHSVWFRIVFTLISVFEAGRVRQCLVCNGFYTNFTVLSKMCDIVFGLD